MKDAETLKRPSEEDFRACLPETAEGPGCAMAVLHKGEVAAEFCTGMASVEHGVPITPDTVFRIASVTKQFLCAAVMTLADAGKLSLDDRLGQHLPELQGTPATVTIAQAMSNTSGIRDHLELWYIAGGGLPVPHRLRDSVAMCARQTETNFPPGSSYLYSNANFLLLSRIAEQAAGERIEDYIERRFFTPLGMTSTKLRPGHHDVIPHLAAGYVEKDGKISRGQITTELWGEGSAHSTLNDLVKWARYYREDPDGLIARMRVPAAFSGGGAGYYGFGLFAEPWRGMSSVGHTGLWPGYQAEIVWFDDPDVTLVCLSNLSTLVPRLVNRKLAERLFDGTLAPAPEGSPDMDLWAEGAAQGPYFSPETLTMVGLCIEDGTPKLEIHGGKVEVLAESPTRLTPAAGAAETAWFDIAGIPEGYIEMQRRNGEVVRLQALDTLPPLGEEGALAGSWWCGETASRLIVTRDADGYRVRTPQYWAHAWVSPPLPAGIMAIEDFTGPWPRRFLLVPTGPDEMAVAGPRVTRLRFKREG
ncbi:serine hydrolase domain-containing protein [Oceaniglobus roseus]|uniref:serine hydrolase domain-containing protein n=1 Tax=Oceaniglobus roseus TaxID=1737570 RepID=UPI000C7F4CA2|nr:serine hydrolase domain-containing protein [Kandeliimicrobium roseum]